MLMTKLKAAAVAGLAITLLAGGGVITYLGAANNQAAGLQEEVLMSVVGDKEKSDKEEEDAPPENEAAEVFQAAKAETLDSLKQLVVAMHAYNDKFKRLPPAIVYSNDGKPLYSWRVLLLPFIEKEALFNDFHLDEPWDSEHNKKLLEKMPDPYAPRRMTTKVPYTTFMQVFVDKDAKRAADARRSRMDMTSAFQTALSTVQRQRFSSLRPTKPFRGPSRSILFTIRPNHCQN